MTFEKKNASDKSLHKAVVFLLGQEGHFSFPPRKRPAKPHSTTDHFSMLAWSLRCLKLQESNAKLEEAHKLLNGTKKEAQDLSLVHVQPANCKIA